MENKRSKNFFLSSNKFISFAWWKNREDLFSIFPALLIEKNIDKGLEIKLNRYIFCLGKRRFEINTGVYNPRNTVLNWKDSALEDFILWMRKSGNENFGKNEVERFFAVNPEWKNLITITSCKNHYIRLLLAKALVDFNSASVVANKRKEKQQRSETLRVSPAESALLDSLRDDHTEESIDVDLSPLDKLGGFMNINEGENNSHHWTGNENDTK